MGHSKFAHWVCRNEFSNFCLLILAGVGDGIGWVWDVCQGAGLMLASDWHCKRHIFWHTARGYWRATTGMQHHKTWITTHSSGRFLKPLENICFRAQPLIFNENRRYTVETAMIISKPVLYVLDFRCVLPIVWIKVKEMSIAQTLSMIQNVKASAIQSELSLYTQLSWWQSAIP